MTYSDRFMRISIKRRLSLTTLLMVTRRMQTLTEEETEERFKELVFLLDHSQTEQEFCRKVFTADGGSKHLHKGEHEVFTCH